MYFLNLVFRYFLNKQTNNNKQGHFMTETKQAQSKPEIDEAKYLNAFKRFLEILPHCSATKLEAISYQDGEVCLCLPAQENIIGNKDENLIHGGAITMLIDTSCGSVAMFANEQPESCPTLDLRIDHFASAAGDKPTYCKAKVVRNAKRIIFIEARVFQDERTIAKATATFMRVGNETLNSAMARFLLGE